jgi:hypothetical protein
MNLDGAFQGRQFVFIALRHWYFPVKLTLCRRHELASGWCTVTYLAIMIDSYAWVSLIVSAVQVRQWFRLMTITKTWCLWEK